MRDASVEYPSSTSIDVPSAIKPRLRKMSSLPALHPLKKQVELQTSYSDNFHCGNLWAQRSNKHSCNKSLVAIQFQCHLATPTIFINVLNLSILCTVLWVTVVRFFEKCLGQGYTFAGNTTNTNIFCLFFAFGYD